VVDKPGLPSAGITILQLSDFHFRADDPVQEARLARLRTLLAGEHYDILALTGDLIHNEAGLPHALAFLAELRPTIAAFSVPGNRDYWESSFKAVLGTPEERVGRSLPGKARLVVGRSRRMLRMFAGNERAALRLHRNDVDGMHRALQAQGIEPLVNRSVNLRSGEYDLWFAGVDDLTQGRPDLRAALAHVPERAVLVLLAHNPDVWLARALDGQEETGPAARSADLVLSGHTHGGQLKLPLVGAWYRQGTRVGRHKPAGWFEDGASHLFVSRGLGESFPFRFGAPPEAALIRLIPAGVQ
jgi:predicted MPP superfamily phosphohydrolase